MITLRRVSFNYLLLLSILFIPAQNAISSIEAWYPDNGKLTFDGNKIMMLDMHWTTAASFDFWIQEGAGLPIQGAGFEIDLAVKKEFFNSCKSDSTFSDKYDDCPTAGSVEGKRRWSFGCGTYSGIQFGEAVPGPTNQRHRCIINFDQDKYTPAPQAWVGINAQTVNRIICPRKSIWCYNSKTNQALTPPPVGNGELLITRGQSSSKTWGNYTAFSNISNSGNKLPSFETTSSVKNSASITPPVVALAVNAVNRGAFGKNFGTNQHPSSVKAEFTINRDISGFSNKFYYLNVNGFDIDTSNEVSVRINSVAYGNLKSSSNNSLNTGDVIEINKSDIITGINMIEFRQKTVGEKWGVTNLYISTSSTPRPPVIGLAIDQPTSGNYGHNYGTNQHKNSLITSFNNPNQKLELAVKGYNITNSSLVAVYINDQLLGRLSVGAGNALNDGDKFIISRSDMLDGQNTIEFVRTGTQTWGVSALNLSRKNNITPIIQLLLLDDDAVSQP